MATVLIGTSGYSYTEWIGPVYPQGTRNEEFLSRYAALFPTVELNFSYYRMPTASQFSRLHSQAPSLVFSVKAHESLTHAVDPASWRESATAFCEAVRVFAESGNLGALLLQFPYSFHYEIDRRRYLDALLNELTGFPLAVEFRNSQWYNNRTIDALRKRNVALVSLDLPPIKGLPPLMDVITSSFAYVRLHGRNKESWWTSDAASRYDYLYSNEELTSIAQRIQGIAQAAARVLVYFNNHRRGQAVENAKALQVMIQDLYESDHRSS